MAKKAGAPAPKNEVVLSYQLLRNVTSPDETATGLRSFIVNLPVLEILKLGTGSNLRSYIPEYNPRQRKRAHDAIAYTIEAEPQRFITRNSGFVIAASDVRIDDQQKTIALDDASIMNGAQSQGEIRRWAENSGEGVPGADAPAFFIRAEVIVDPDAAQVVETAIARNTATPVRNVSQAGARGQLDELAKSIAQAMPGTTIQMNETDDGLDTRKILQYARLLMPTDVSGSDTPSEKLRPYRQAEQCLTEFCSWADRRSSDPAAMRKYNFVVQMAAKALKEYAYWEGHPGWNGQRLQETTKNGRAVRRDKAGKITWVAPGIVFPVVSAMSAFVVESAPGRWELRKPEAYFDDEKMIKAAVGQFRSVNSDPMQMGRSSGVYEALRNYPATLVDVISTLSETK